ncbi:DUF423 domain-containing protein [Aliidiomarina maris]|uniref:DUF423 domain-containing protein n=1 Tax=Aliidiomarina maris TaxID=531312 RepID=A0A327WVD4_9GAMM|nr:DUF423 domain-containing protein [Aliidiomarina maris]MBA3989073.1 DUF423 domain-containing protein [Idiomarina sp.]RAJ96548.1 uncharacterized membrane protein YgdD (TMEM256/DUF423 family) [Aliidiomarina maris]RUO23706.1 DUF423 domain-containing protein [Aliidiomarina maris]
MAFIFISIAAMIAALSVALGAFAAHGLQGRLSDASIEVFKTAVHYQFMHAIALFGVGILLFALSTHAVLSNQVNLTALYVAGFAWLLGILLFSGSLYGLSLAQWRWLGPVTPLGGLCFIIGWVSLALAGWQLYRQLGAL